MKCTSEVCNLFSEQSPQVTGEDESLRSKRQFLTTADDFKDKSFCQLAGDILAPNTKPSSSLLSEARNSDLCCYNSVF